MKKLIILTIFLITLYLGNQSRSGMYSIQEKEGVIYYENKTQYTQRVEQIVKEKREETRKQRISKWKEILAGYNSPIQYKDGLLLNLYNTYGYEFSSLILAISGSESSFAKNYLYNNAFGIGGADNLFHFKSIEDSFHYTARLIKQREGDKLDINSIKHWYCPPTKESWAKNTQYFLKLLTI